MNTFVFVCLFAIASTSAALNCYQCATGASGCNDPFNPSATGVSKTGDDPTNKFCEKKVIANIVMRDGTSACVEIPFTTILGFTTGTACCTKDLCNGAGTIYQSISLLVFSIVAIFLRFYST